MRGIIKACAVKAPDFGDRKTLLLEDLAVITGGQVISKDKGFKLDKLTSEQLSTMLGRARTITIEKEKTTIVDGKGTEESISLRSEEIKAQIDKASSFYEKEKLQERLGKLIGGVAIINVGGNSEVEMREKKDRVEDALFATKAAIAEGIIAGGGISLIRAFNAALSQTKDWSDDKKKGVKIVSEACFAPFKKILENSGDKLWYEILHNTLSSELNNSTYNAKTNEVVDAFETGLLDPAKVTRTALQNAASVSGVLLTTEACIVNKPVQENKNNKYHYHHLLDYRDMEIHYLHSDQLYKFHH
jgi:chaperonin GroEL